VVGILDTTYPESYRKSQFGAFEDKFPEYGWNDGGNVRIVRRVPGPSKEKITSEAVDLVTLAPDVLISNSTVLTAALAQQTQKIPIVFISVGDPIQSGFSEGLARPSRNMTGFTVFDPAMGGKMLQLCKDIKPQLRRVTAMYNPDLGAGKDAWSVFMARTRQFAEQMTLEFEEAQVRMPAEIEAAMAQLNETRRTVCGCGSVYFQ
jgi:putative ABC transport system substrate-binding protein